MCEYRADRNNEDGSGVLYRYIKAEYSREIHQPAQVGVQRLELVLEFIETGRGGTALWRQPRALVEVEALRRAVVVLRAGADDVRICVYTMTMGNKRDRINEGTHNRPGQGWIRIVSTARRRDIGQTRAPAGCRA